jgi:hypothetical protein
MASASPLAFLVSVPSITLTLTLSSTSCDVSPETSPFAFDDEGTAVSSSRPAPEPDAAPDPDPDPSTDAEEPTAQEPALLAFVTSLDYTADLGGLEGADEICRFEAEAAQLPGTYRAWISDASSDAIDRIDGDGPWHGVDGERLFNNHAHLRTSPLQAIAIDPLGHPASHALVWTGTGTGGRWLGTDSCGGWTVEDPFGDAGTGQASTGTQWTDAGPGPCTWPARLYCLQVP